MKSGLSLICEKCSQRTFYSVNYQRFPTQLNKYSIHVTDLQQIHYKPNTDPETHDTPYKCPS